MAAATSATVRAIGPATVRSVCPGKYGTRPNVGLCPTSPVKLAGSRIEPPPSLPIATVHSPAATADAAPPLDPPGVWSRCHGLRVAPNARVVVSTMTESSGIVVLPRMTAPASSSRALTGASNVEGVVRSSA